jgi:hypothetical protein
MSDSPASVPAPNRALRTVHRGVLGALAVCAVAIALSAKPGTSSISEGEQRSYTTVAVALAAVSILTRRRPTARVANPRVYLISSLASLLCAGGLGITGVTFALAGGARSTALVYALAGAIFALRPPRPIPGRPPADPS